MELMSKCIWFLVSSRSDTRLRLVMLLIKELARGKLTLSVLKIEIENRWAPSIKTWRHDHQSSNLWSETKQGRGKLILKPLTSFNKGFQTVADPLWMIEQCSYFYCWKVSEKFESWFLSFPSLTTGKCMCFSQARYDFQLVLLSSSNWKLLIAENWFHE